MEGTIGLPFETGPEVGGKDLGAFMHVDCSVVKIGDVIETGEVDGEEIDQGGGGVVGFVDKVGNGAREVSVEDAARFADAVDTLV